MATKAKRGRNWWFVVYPESLKPEWVQILRDKGLRGFVSPLHDKDTKEQKDGSEAQENTKKAHYHVLLIYKGVKSREQVQALAQELLAAGSVQVEQCQDLTNCVRYLCHLDNPEKAQYSPEDVQEIGAVNWNKMSIEDEDEQQQGEIANIIGIICQYEIKEFSALTEFLLSESPELFNTFRRNSYFFGQYLKSKQFFTKKVDSQG